MRLEPPNARPATGATADRPAPRVSVLGLPVDLVDMDVTLRVLTGWIAEQRATDRTSQPLHSMDALERSRQVVTLNPEMVMAAQRDAGFAAVIRDADLVTADGAGVVWALRMRGMRAARRVTGVDLLEAAAALAARRGYRVFLLGAAPGIASEAAAQLEARHRGLRVADTYAGSPRAEDAAAILARIHAARPNLVFVAFGSPAQELWIATHREQLGAAVAVGVGGAFDFIAGRVPRAPAPLRRLGLEWLYRLWREPWRWHRMLALPRFAAAAVAESVRERMRK